MKTVRVPREIRQRVEAEIHRCIAIAEKTYNRTFRFPGLDYSLRGTTAGTANDGTYTIKLNSILLMENLDKFIEGYNSTVAHEFAHLVDGIVNPETREFAGMVMTRRGPRRKKRSLHGPTWKRIMMLFGCDPSGRCHDFEVKNAQVKKHRKHVWVCGCGGGRIVLTDLKHNRQLAASGNRIYMRGHPASRCGRYSYKGIEGQELPEMPLAASKATPKKPKAGTKKEKAIQVYREFSHMNRDFIVAKIANACNMSLQGATTYYYTAKKEA